MSATVRAIPSRSSLRLFGLARSVASAFQAPDLPPDDIRRPSLASIAWLFFGAVLAAVLPFSDRLKVRPRPGSVGSGRQELHSKIFIPNGG